MSHANCIKSGLIDILLLHPSWNSFSSSLAIGSHIKTHKTREGCLLQAGVGSGVGGLRENKSAEGRFCLAPRTS